MTTRPTKPAADKPAKTSPPTPAKSGSKPAPKAKGAATAKATAKVSAAETAKTPATPAAKAPAFKLKDLVSAVADSTGARKPDVRQMVEATLAALASALQSGADLAVPPLGRARIVKSESRNGAAMMTLKLRLGAADKPGSKQTLAADGEDS